MGGRGWNEYTEMIEVFSSERPANRIFVLVLLVKVNKSDRGNNRFGAEERLGPQGRSFCKSNDFSNRFFCKECQHSNCERRF